MSKVDVLGIRVDPLTIDQAVERICELARQPGAKYITKPYVEFVERAYHDSELRGLLSGAALSLPDGVALQWASAYAAGPHGLWPLVKSLFGIMLNPQSITTVLPERFAGVDATWRLLERCQTEGLKVFLIGSPANSDVSKTAIAINSRLPKLAVVGTAPGQISGRAGLQLFQAIQTGQVDVNPLASQVSQSGADIILTGAGFPQQEALNAALAARLSRGVLIGEGGSFDYDSFGGHRRRAPRILRRLGLEWLWRLALQPSRWRRQTAIPRFIWHVYRNY